MPLDIRHAHGYGERNIRAFERRRRHFVAQSKVITNAE